MRPRNILLIIGLVLCVFSIAIITIKGSPKDRVSLDSVSEIGEGVLHSVGKVGRIFTSVSDQEEMEIGDKIHAKIFGSQVAKGLKDTPIDKYVNEVGSRLTENVKRKKIKYKFHVIEGYRPTAFSLAGGHIYITIGLLGALKSESELAAILGHEITHVDAKHSIGIIQHKIAAQKTLGAGLDDFVDIGYNLFLRPGYSEVQETEADAGGAYLLYKAGYHPLGIVYAFERTDKEGLKKENQNLSATPIDETIKAAGGIIGRYFASHPAALERIDRIKKYISDNKLINENSRFYIGQKNYEEKISYNKKRYKEEFKKDYVIIEEKKEVAVTVTTPEEGEKLLNEVYTSYGRIVSGMTIEEVEKILPSASRVFKYENRMGYKDITVYDFENNNKSETIGLWIALENNKVKGLRIIK